MKKKEPVSTIMTKTIHAVQIEDKLTDALELVRKYGVRHVPVLHGKQLVGILSKSDLNRLTYSGFFDGEEDADDGVFDMLTISQIMSHKPRVVKAAIRFMRWLRFFQKKNFMPCRWLMLKTKQN